MTAVATDTAAGLAGYLAAKRAAMAPYALHASRHGVPEAVEPLRATARVAGRTGIREVRLREFRLISDSGPDFAGFDLGPSSPELLLGSLSSCLAHTWLIHAALQDVAIESLEVDVSAQMQAASAAFPHSSLPSYPFDFGYEVRVGYRGDPANLDRVHEAVRERCPILALLSRATTVTGRVTVVEAGS